MTKAQQAKLHRIITYIVLIYVPVPMIFKTHLNRWAPESPTNLWYLRDLLNFSSEDTILMKQSVKKIFVKHFNAWMNPTNLALNVYSKNLTSQLKHCRMNLGFIPDHANASSLAWKTAPLKSFFSISRKNAPCLKVESAFWNSVDDHNHSCERYTGHMTRCINDRKIQDYKTDTDRSRLK